MTNNEIMNLIFWISVMNKNKIQKEEKKEINKQELFTNAKIALKKYFIGLDTVIDTIFKQIEVWYLYPEFLTRPTIINLWGLTGVGKTDFVRKLVQCLQLQDKFCENQLNMRNSSIVDTGNSFPSMFNESYTKSLSQNILLSSGLKPDEQMVLLLDEIHQYRTIDNKGNEIQNYNYADIWRLLSDGILYDKSTVLKYLKDTITKLKLQYQRAQELETNNTNNEFSFNEKLLINMGIVVKKKPDKEEKPVSKDKLYNFITNTLDKNGMSDFERFHKGNYNSVNSELLATILTITEEDRKYIHELKLYYQGAENAFMKKFQADNNETTKGQLFTNCSSQVMLRFLEKKYKELLSQSYATIEEEDIQNENYVYSKMLIFICGNLSESIYTDTNTSDYNEVFSKLMKFLQERFRPEEISRFGNNYIIYPVLTQENYNVLIEREITAQEKRLQKKFDDTNIVIDHKKVFEKINEVPYDLKSGVRPMVSLIGRVLSSIIPELLLKRNEVSLQKEVTHGEQRSIEVQGKE